MAVRSEAEEAASTTKVGRFEIGQGVLRSAHDAYALSDIRHMRLRRPWLVLTGVAASGVVAIALVFWPELRPMERAIAIVVPATAVAIASMIARLKLDSIVLGKDEGVIWGSYRELVRVKANLEQALRHDTGIDTGRRSGAAGGDGIERIDSHEGERA